MLQNINLQNIFWFFIGYGVVTLIVMRFIPKDKRKKILTYTIQGSVIEKASALISIISRYAMILLSLFIPIYANTYYFLIGSLLYLIGLILTTIAMWQFSRVQTNEPITTGIYRISRNPMQVMVFVMYIGIAVMGNNSLLWIFTIVYILTSYPMFFMQETYCLEAYGKVYQEYMQRTPRILLIKPKVRK